MAFVHAGTVVFRLVSSVSVVAACLGRCGRLAALLVAARRLADVRRLPYIVYDVIVSRVQADTRIALCQQCLIVADAVA